MRKHQQEVSQLNQEIVNRERKAQVALIVAVAGISMGIGFSVIPNIASEAVLGAILDEMRFHGDRHESLTNSYYFTAREGEIHQKPNSFNAVQFDAGDCEVYRDGHPSYVEDGPATVYLSDGYNEEGICDEDESDWDISFSSTLLTVISPPISLIYGSENVPRSSRYPNMPFYIQESEEGEGDGGIDTITVLVGDWGLEADDLLED